MCLNKCGIGRYNLVPSLFIARGKSLVKCVFKFGSMRPDLTTPNQIAERCCALQKDCDAPVPPCTNYSKKRRCLHVHGYLYSVDRLPMSLPARTCAARAKEIGRVVVVSTKIATSPRYRHPRDSRAQQIKRIRQKNGIQCASNRGKQSMSMINSVFLLVIVATHIDRQPA